MKTIIGHGCRAFCAMSVLVFAVAVQAASFDCAKAKTKVEHIICDNPEISKLDEELAAAYTTAIKNAKQAEVIKQAQRRWIKERNGCQDAECLKSAYRIRKDKLIGSKVQIADSQKSEGKGLDFVSEADKLKFIQKIVVSRVFQYASYLPRSKFCDHFMKDFRVNKEVRAVEPDVQTNNVDDPRLAKWHRCEDESLKGTRPDLFDYLATLGGPPYRYYRINLDGNPNNGKEDVIYTEIYKQGERGAGTGSTGYHWVDLQACTVKGGAPVDVQFPPRPLPPNKYHLNLVVKYDDHYLALELDPWGESYSLVANAFDPKLNHHGYFCSWDEIAKRQPGK